MNDNELDFDEPKRKFMLFGRDVNKIPCFKKTFMTSISSGLVTGFAYFMFTSRVGRATFIGYGTFFGVTIIYCASTDQAWSGSISRCLGILCDDGFHAMIHCRYNYAMDKHKALMFSEAARQRVLLEGTELDPNFKSDIKEA